MSVTCVLVLCRSLLKTKWFYVVGVVIKSGLQYIVAFSQSSQKHSYARALVIPFEFAMGGIKQVPCILLQRSVCVAGIWRE